MNTKAEMLKKLKTVCFFYHRFFFVVGVIF